MLELTHVFPTSEREKRIAIQGLVVIFSLVRHCDTTNDALAFILDLTTAWDECHGVAEHHICSESSRTDFRRDLRTFDATAATRRIHYLRRSARNQGGPQFESTFSVDRFGSFGRLVVTIWTDRELGSRMARQLAHQLLQRPSRVLFAIRQIVCMLSWVS